ncbi:MAG: ABC transporter permease [Clostridiales bacterium]|nr:ABC transporter permease [Clostridiales bacterium]
MFKEIYKYREMIYTMVRKDLRGRYKGSVLGFLWTFINPLLQLVVYYFVFSMILGNNIPKFYLYLFVGLIPWIFFSASLTGGSISIIAQKDLIKKIYFPREIIPISYVTSCFVNMLLSFVVVIAVVIFSGVMPSILGIICLPAIMLVEYLLCLGMALITSALTVYFRDLEHILGIVSMAWMYATPICYPASLVVEKLPERFVFLYNLNPMTPIVEAYRAVLYEGGIPRMETLLSATALGAVFLIIGIFVFRKLNRNFAEEL